MYVTNCNPGTTRFMGRHYDSLQIPAYVIIQQLFGRGGASALPVSRCHISRSHRTYKYARVDSRARH